MGGMPIQHEGTQYHSTDEQIPDAENINEK